jgi:hypothetical protein
LITIVGFFFWHGAWPHFRILVNWLVWWPGML